MTSNELEQKRFAILSALQYQQQQLEHLINGTPTGSDRNDLTDLNIHLGVAIDNFTGGKTKFADNLFESSRLLAKKIVPRNYIGKQPVSEDFYAIPSEAVKEAVLFLCNRVFSQNKAAGWWTDIKTGESLEGKRHIPTLLMLCVSELAEGMEGHRKNKMDDHLPHRKMLEVELADCLIRIVDMAGGMGYDLAGATAEKLAYNAQRADHKIETRKQDDGKKY